MRREWNRRTKVCIQLTMGTPRGHCDAEYNQGLACTRASVTMVRSNMLPWRRWCSGLLPDTEIPMAALQEALEMGVHGCFPEVRDEHSALGASHPKSTQLDSREEWGKEHGCPERTRWRTTGTCPTFAPRVLRMSPLCVSACCEVWGAR